MVHVIYTNGETPHPKSVDHYDKKKVLVHCMTSPNLHRLYFHSVELWHIVPCLKCSCNKFCLRCEVLIAMLLNVAALWDVTPCSEVFEGSYFLPHNLLFTSGQSTIP